MNSDSTIHHLPKLRPSKPIDYGLTKVFGAVFTIAITSLMFYGGIESVKISSTLGVLGGLILIIIAALSIVVAGYYLADGTLSLLFLLVKQDGHPDHETVFYHNEGYLHHPTVADRWFGKRVVPVNSPEMLRHGKRVWYFLNGVTLKIISEWKYESGTESTETTFAMKIECLFAGGSLSAEYSTTDEACVKNLRRTECDPRYILVEYIGKDLHICDFGTEINSVHP